MENVSPVFSNLTLRFKLANRRDLLCPVTRVVQQPDLKKDANREGTLLLDEELIFSPTTFIDDLKQAGYRLSGVRCEERTNPKRHFVALFTFTFAQDGLVVTESFARMRGKLEVALVKMLQAALWKRIRVFANPVIDRDDEPGYGTHWASITLDQRQPLHQPNGELVTVWQKNSDGERIGGAPEALKASHHLRFTENVLRFEEAFKEAVAA